MEMQFLVPVGVVIMAAGVFAVMWPRMRRPVRVSSDKPRIQPSV